MLCIKWAAVVTGMLICDVINARALGCLSALIDEQAFCRFGRIARNYSPIEAAANSPIPMRRVGLVSVSIR